MTINDYSDKILYENNGFIVKNFLSHDKKFLNYSLNFKNEINLIKDEKYVAELGGFKSGNLNIELGKYSKVFINLLFDNNFGEYFKFLIGENIEEYEIFTGGNLNFPGSKSQLFHTDGNWDPRMIIVNIATSDINLKNGPIEVLPKTHKKKTPYWKFIIKSKFLNQEKIKLKMGEILIREHRLWHRGTVNNSNQFREMVGIMFIKKKKLLKTKIIHHKL